MQGFDWIKLSREASILMSQGHSSEAVSLYKKIIRSKPIVPEVHNNLAVALRASGYVKDAIKSYKKAIKINPEYTVARKNLARALNELGRSEEALEQFAQIIKKETRNSELQTELSFLISTMRFSRPSFIARSLFLFLFDLDHVDLQKLSTAAVSLVICNRRFATLVNAASVYGAEAECCFLTPKTLKDPLLINILTWTIVPSNNIERWITVARQQLLLLINKGQQIDTDEALLWALALQCHSTEFVFSITNWEKELLIQILKNKSKLAQTQIAVIAMYLPIGSLTMPSDFWQKKLLLKSTPPGMKLLIQRDIMDPLTQAQIAVNIPKLSHQKGLISEKVMRQYEASPYPRWLSIDREENPRNLGERLKEQFPLQHTGGLSLDNPAILVAGCGTGRHAISTANRYSGSNVLAIDLSLRSLSYAVMQANKISQSNIKFAQADILNLGKIEQRFDLVESSGVLHHMEEPLAGWLSLRNLLKSNGFMRIGLYSSKGRRRWNKLRETIPCGLDNNSVTNFIRDRRSSLIGKTAPGNDHIITRIADFYSLSGCRDLLFHEKEIQFTIPQIAELIMKLNLTFLGFANLTEPVTQKFKKQFKNAADYYDLDKWDIFEQDNPDTFIAMYQFWCQAKD